MLTHWRWSLFELDLGFAFFSHNTMSGGVEVTPYAVQKVDPDVSSLVESQ